MSGEVTHPAQGIGRRVGFLVTTRNAVIFLLALAATSAALTTFAPFPKLGNLWRKYHHYREHQDEYSLIYIGSSRVFHEFIPAKFDAALEQAGHRVRSFNFGQDGMWPPESFYMLRRILALKPKNLKWVFIDLMGIKADLDGNEATLRSVYWHDLRHTWLAVRHAIEIDMAGQRTWTEKATLCWYHIDLWMQQASGLGKGNEQLEITLKLAQRMRKPIQVPNGGFEPGGSGPLQGEMLRTFTDAVERLKQGRPDKPIQPVLRDGLMGIIEDVRATGAEPVFIVAAGIYGAERFSDWPPPGVHVLRFDDPNKYPHLFDPALRYDPFHLNAKGAEIFTQHLATQFRGILERKP